MSEVIDTASSAVSSRRGLLGRAALMGAVALPTVAVLNREALAAPQQSLDASSREAFTDIRGHENDHVAFLRGALGKAARPKPTFKGLTTANFNAFVAASQVFENVGVGAYLGALPAIQDKGYVAAAGSIALIEARHAGFLNVFSGKDNTAQALTNKPTAFDKPLTLKQVVDAVSPYIANLNGGTVPTALNDDVTILNFALLLEYLEAEYYNLNIPKYFK